MSDERLDLEIELIEASLLPAERLVRDGNAISITSDDSILSLHVAVSPNYPTSGSVAVEVKGENIGRDEAQGWKEWLKNTLIEEWDAGDEYAPFVHCCSVELRPATRCSNFYRPTCSQFWPGRQRQSPRQRYLIQVPAPFDRATRNSTMSSSLRTTSSPPQSART